MNKPPMVPHQIRKVYEGRIFSLMVESITLPKGGALDVDVIRHPGSVVLIPVTDRGEIILVQQYRHAIGRWVWELPAGSLKRNEDPDTAAARECHEEIGLVPGKIERLGALYPTPGYCDEEMIFYRASALREPAEGERAQPDEDEDIEPQPFSVERIAAMVAAGEIVDMKTVAALFFIGAP